MNGLELYRQMEPLNCLKAVVDEANREAGFAESRKWRERAELEIESYLRVLYEIPGTTVH